MSGAALGILEGAEWTLGTPFLSPYVPAPINPAPVLPLGCLDTGSGPWRPLAIRHLSHLPLSFTPRAGTTGGELCGAPTPTPSGGCGGTRRAPVSPVSLGLALQAAPRS